MTKTWHQRATRIFSAWTHLVERFNIPFILIIIGTAALCLDYTLDNLGMNTNTKDMLSPELNWRQLDEAHDLVFPQYTDNLLVVIEAGTPDEANDAAKLLYERLLKEKKTFKTVYYPADLPFFRTSSLLYLDTDELQDLADNLAAIQPFLARLTEDQSIRGLFNMLSDAIQAKLDGDDVDLKTIPQQIDMAFKAVDENRYYRLSWQNLMSGENKADSINREFIILQPVLNYDSLFPAEKSIKRLRKVARELNLTKDNHIQVRLTGSAALSYEEMKSVSRGMEISALVALLLVTIILFIGLKSPWAVIATLITLVTGLVYTAFFAAIAVGDLNLISVAFTVLYIGLGVDFAIHFCLRYREISLTEKDNNIALVQTSNHVGESLFLCAVTTAIGFYAFIPTDYDGVAELGLISGTGMFISLVITLTLLPALLSLFPVKFKEQKSSKFLKNLFDNLATFPQRKAGSIKIVTLVLSLISLVLVTQISFDHNTLNLQPKKNESVKTFLDLLSDSDTSPWTGVVLAKNKSEAARLDKELEQLPLVDKTVWINDFIPGDQDEKLVIIEQIDLLLGALTTISQLPPPDMQEQLDSIHSFNNLLEDFINQENPGPDYISLHKTINKFMQQSGSMQTVVLQDKLKQLEKNLLATFPGRFNALIDSMLAENVTLDSLPDEIRSRWYSKDYYRLEIYPVENLSNNDAMRRFVTQVRTVTPDLIGSPVIDIEAGDTVVKAFKQAFLYALATIIVLLLILLDRKKDTLYLLIPLLLAVLFTGSISVLAGIPLNFANVIALPLLMGIGVDSGIHIIHRWRTALPGEDNLLATSSARAVVFSALTTIFSIGNLALSVHPGTASLGILLTIGISMTLLCTLIVLPSLLARNNITADK